MIHEQTKSLTHHPTLTLPFRALLAAFSSILFAVPLLTRPTTHTPVLFALSVHISCVYQSVEFCKFGRRVSEATPDFQVRHRKVGLRPSRLSSSFYVPKLLFLCLLSSSQAKSLACFSKFLTQRRKEILISKLNQIAK